VTRSCTSAFGADRAPPDESRKVSTARISRLSALPLPRSSLLSASSDCSRTAKSARKLCASGSGSAPTEAGRGGAREVNFW